MRSLFFISLMNGAPWGGSEELWYRAALLAARSGHAVGCALFEWKEKKERVAALQAAGVQVFLLPNKKQRPAGLFSKLLHKPLSRIRLQQAIRALPLRQYDFVVVSQGGFEIYTDTWQSLHRRLDRFALLFHNYNEDAAFPPGKARILKEWMSRASVNLFAAARIREVMEEKLQARFPNSGLLINPISFAPPREVTPFPASERVRFVVLAALDTDRKAQDVLIRALARPHWKAREWELHLFGSGKDDALLARLIEEQGLKDKVFLKGQTADPGKVLQEAHLLLQLTKVDAMPLAVVEALACSRPVAATRLGDIPAWVQADVNGWICEAASEDAMDETLEKAWRQRARWEEMGRRSFEIFREKFPPSPEQYLLDQMWEPQEHQGNKMH